MDKTQYCKPYFNNLRITYELLMPHFLWFMMLHEIGGVAGLVATVRSVGASTRIEGSKLSDEEIDVLLKNLDISKLEERDQQEVVGYFEVLDLIDEHFEEISIAESSLKKPS